MHALSPLEHAAAVIAGVSDLSYAFTCPVAVISRLSQLMVDIARMDMQRYKWASAGVV